MVPELVVQPKEGIIYGALWNGANGTFSQIHSVGAADKVNNPAVYLLPKESSTVATPQHPTYGSAAFCLAKIVLLPLTQEALYFVKYSLVDNCRMCIWRIVLIQLSSVSQRAAGQCWCPERLLPKGISCVFFVFQNSGNRLNLPLIGTQHRINALPLFHVSCNFLHIVSLQKIRENLSYILCPSRINDNAAVFILLVAKGKG